MNANNDSKDIHGIFSAARQIRGFEDVAEQIQEAISNGSLNPGDRLPNERDLAVVFNVSRATLREAIRSLEGAGIVEVSRGKSGGTFITDSKSTHLSKAFNALIRFRGATIEDLSEFRGSFEAETAFWAAKRRTDEDVTELLRILELYKNEAENGSWEKLVELDVSFHNQIAIASKNSIREAIMFGINEVFNKASLMLAEVADQQYRKIALEELNMIAAAIISQDPEKAHRAMSEHVKRNTEIEILEQKKRLKNEVDLNNN